MKTLKKEISEVIQTAFYQGKYDPCFEIGAVDVLLDICKKFALEMVGEDNHVFMNDKQVYINPMANYLTMDKIRNQLRKEIKERIKEA